MNYSALLLDIIKSQASAKEISWIETKASGSLQTLQTAFVATPRFISKNIIQSTDGIDGVSFQNWTLDKLVRAYFLTKLDSSDKDVYTNTLDTLFDTAENNEAVALISALPFLAYPENWMLRATNAVRSNIGPVFDAIAFQNPFPKKHFSELAWNQLVLKCIFNDKPIHLIEGLDERANQELANSISYLAHERWSAGRTIPSQAWRLVSGFMNETIWPDIEHLFQSTAQSDHLAAVLVSKETNYAAAKAALAHHQELSQQVTDGVLSWKTLEN
ncbi:EboA domain-containing protein [Emticicia sp. 17c]|uniref:EboA domain-containing protein n=1 Tax=Emticicia sp. 17c TaxID=3127704 RepID=UPI00301B825B